MPTCFNQDGLACWRIGFGLALRLPRQLYRLRPSITTPIPSLWSLRLAARLVVRYIYTRIPKGPWFSITTILMWGLIKLERKRKALLLTRQAVYRPLLTDLASGPNNSEVAGGLRFDADLPPVSPATSIGTLTGPLTGRLHSPLSASNAREISYVIDWPATTLRSAI